jgi:AmmeMemoRadiSam system protein A
MSLLGVVIAPHPPILIPEIGKGEEQEAKKTIEGMGKMATFAKEQKPEIVVVLSPHGNMFRDGICILDADALEGDFLDFGFASYRMKKKTSRFFLERLRTALESTSFSYLFMTREEAHVYAGRFTLDHGALVPLYFMDKEYDDYQVIHITPGGLDLQEIDRFGTLLGKVADEMEQRVLILASADLSHCLKDAGPYTFSKEGPVFDQIVVDSIGEKHYDDLLNMKPHLYEPAGQCGLRPIVMALGAMEGLESQPEVFSYEGPYGVGYMTAAISVIGKSQPTKHQATKSTVKSDPFVALARKSVEYWTKEGQHLDWADYKRALTDLEFVEQVEQDRSGAFVSLHLDGRLRGCIGTVEPTRAHLALEIIHNAVEACAFDPRFPAVEPWELANLDISVDILKTPEPIESWTELDPLRYGVIVEKGRRRGLLLPHLDGVETVEAQLDIAMQKAGILSIKNATVYRFEVVRHEDGS